MVCNHMMQNFDATSFMHCNIYKLLFSVIDHSDKPSMLFHFCAKFPFSSLRPKAERAFSIVPRTTCTIIVYKDTLFFPKQNQKTLMNKALNTSKVVQKFVSGNHMMYTQNNVIN